MLASRVDVAVSLRLPALPEPENFLNSEQVGAGASIRQSLVVEVARIAGRSRGRSRKIFSAKRPCETRSSGLQAKSLYTE
jgi:hypothetical protein